MVGSLSLNEIAWKRTIIFLFLIIIPNFLVMQVQLVGPVNDMVGLGTALDLVIILPLALYFFGFKKRVSWLVLCAFVFWGLLLANWIIPDEADAYLSYFNRSVIVIEAGVIVLELVLFVAIVKRIPLLLKNYKNEKNMHYHFLLSFSAAIQSTFSFKNERLNKFQFTLRILATDIAAIYYSLFSWRKSVPVIEKGKGNTFTFHKNGSYQGVFFMIVHAMIIEIVAVHVIVSNFSYNAAWILTGLDIYTLLFIISDYQAIRLSPVILDSKGIHFQKGIRQYGFVPWEQVNGVNENTKTPKEVDQDRQAIALALHGLEKEPIPYVIKLKEPLEIQQIFGFKKIIESIYLKMDEPHKFNETVHSYLKDINFND
ncbi:hypothetical protein MXL46_17180 [Heyndrickxia sporothermodurans]|uniref:Beta-carotene 15,15'-monooxygenase n=2 Tax=Heyndrickxia sporothermodurans TaxID=46224 RepID=A0AB37HDE2_9BACI|nr:hypothetical protein [Heyndrickxia sporothermodurans]MBL5767618.1 hypothetical protein [Heyndrickxia sporothermodurans]MBL5771121.1 hypothetical protein [Heyndrickxia sporothermodurans]MBL5775381.1 hypothetical protein [Heyndrickxia sporothermodurans]MBL5778332.1 hypothetical protein [Heyndrickxia sporothermodurans]MBL5782341.1 hypothetical protein [Heyndrickxia sporothermodurans]